MCCVVLLGALIGPRVSIVAWWLLDSARWSGVFGTFLWPLLGLLFLPWTTLVFVWVAPGGVSGLGLVALVLAVLFDLGVLGGGYRQRR